MEPLSGINQTATCGGGVIYAKFMRIKFDIGHLFSSVGLCRLGSFWGFVIVDGLRNGVNRENNGEHGSFASMGSVGCRTRFYIAAVDSCKQL